MHGIYVAIILFCMGLYAILTENNLIKIGIGINIMEASLLLLLVLIAYTPGDTAPILGVGDKAVMADPIPQAFALTAIVIGAATTALYLGLVIKISERYDTIDLDELRRKGKL